MTNFIQLTDPTNKTQIWQTTTGNLPPQKENLYGGFNLGLHVQDDPQNVHQNRTNLLASIQAKFPHIEQIHWLNQVHGDRVVDMDNLPLESQTQSADAHITTHKNIALAIMTADCVPVMLASADGEVIAGIHAGWQGLAKGIIFNTLAQMQKKSNLQSGLQNSENWQAWVGACIAREHYEVDERVKTQTLATLEAQLLEKNLALTNEQKQQFFIPKADKVGHYLADLPLITKFQLELCGLKAENIHLSGLDSYGDSRFYSYRQQTEQGLAVTGRMATLIFKA